MTIFTISKRFFCLQVIVSISGDRYAAEALHGTGYNKWFDKTLSVTVFKNGRTCVNAEHSWADAPVCCQAFEYAFYQDYRVFG